MKSKTKDFQFSEEIIFKNEIIHFFNIDSNKSTLYIYLEIEGKKIKSEKSKKYYYKIDLKDDDIQNIQKEMKCIIIEDVELTIIIRILSKYIKFFRKKSKSFHKKIEENGNKVRPRKNTIQENFLRKGMSIKEKIKIFSGEFIKRQINNKVIPGKLIIPKLFQQDVTKKNNKKENKNKIVEEEVKEKK